jgi:hypothetical protein
MATMDLTGLQAECLSALGRGLDGDPGGGGDGDMASTVASTDDASVVTSIDAVSTVTSTDTASDVAGFGAFVVARWADSTAAVDSVVVAEISWWWWSSINGERLHDHFSRDIGRFASLPRLNLFRMGSKSRCIRSMPTEMQSRSENDFECLASYRREHSTNGQYSRSLEQLGRDRGRL